MEITRFSSYCVAVFRWLLTDDLTEAQRGDRILGCNHLSRPGVRGPQSQEAGNRRKVMCVGSRAQKGETKKIVWVGHRQGPVCVCSPTCFCDALQGFYYGRIYADNLFVFSITMTFCLVAPLILPVSFLFFFGALVVYKRQLLFVYENEFESGGAFWPRVYTRMVIALYFMQVHKNIYTTLWYRYIVVYTVYSYICR